MKAVGSKARKVENPKYQFGGITRKRLLLTAGKLFAENGFKETSVRTIANRANVNIGAINYHFGSKDNLYFECVKYVIDKMRTFRLAPDVKLNLKEASPQEVANAFYKLIYRDAQNHLSPKNPLWHTKLMLKTVMTKSPILKKILREILLPEHEIFRNLIVSSIPGLTEQQARFWANTVFSQIIFYDFSREALLLFMEKEEFPKEFIDAVADHIAHTTITGLGLPEPDKSLSRDS